VGTWNGDIAKAAPDEHDELKWYAVSDLDSIDLAEEFVAIACRRAIEHFQSHLQ